MAPIPTDSWCLGLMIQDSFRYPHAITWFICCWIDAEIKAISQSSASSDGHLPKPMTNLDLKRAVFCPFHCAICYNSYRDL